MERGTVWGWGGLSSSRPFCLTFSLGPRTQGSTLNPLFSAFMHLAIRTLKSTPPTSRKVFPLKTPTHHLYPHLSTSTNVLCRRCLQWTRSDAQHFVPPTRRSPLFLVNPELQHANPVGPGCALAVASTWAVMCDGCASCRKWFKWYSGPQPICMQHFLGTSLAANLSQKSAFLPLAARDGCERSPFSLPDRHCSNNPFYSMLIRLTVRQGLSLADTICDSYFSLSATCWRYTVCLSCHLGNKEMLCSCYLLLEDKLVVYLLLFFFFFLSAYFIFKTKSYTKILWSCFFYIKRLQCNG